MMTNQQLTPDEAIQAIRTAYENVCKATESRHIVFTSPAPSTTESAIRKNIRNAKDLLEISLALLRA